MDKDKIKKQLDDSISALKLICKDAHHFDALMDSIMSLKGQLDVEEVELVIPTKDVIKEYDFDSFKFVRTKRGILLHCKGGYDMFVKPTMQTLYGHLSMILDWKDGYEELSEEHKEIYDALFSATFSICSLPCSAFLKDEFAFDIATKYIEFINHQAEEALNAPLQDETPELDAEFNDRMEMAENLKQDVENE